MGSSTATTPEGNSSEILVRAEGIEKTYGSRLPFTRSVTVLTGADLEIRTGEIVGIIGALMFIESLNALRRTKGGKLPPRPARFRTRPSPWAWSCRTDPAWSPRWPRSPDPGEPLLQEQSFLLLKMRKKRKKS